MTALILFNPHAGNGTAGRETRNLSKMLLGDSLKYQDMTEIDDYAKLFAGLDPETRIILSGGDGTLNRFINDTEGLNIPNEIYYYATGSGNDFLTDLGKTKGCEPFSLKEYLLGLPTVEVKGKHYRFLNGIGYGIDGSCCKVGDEQREKSDKPINYTAIAIKGLLFHYKPTNAVITVDGVRHEFKKVWLAPTMF